MGFKFLYSK